MFQRNHRDVIIFIFAVSTSIISKSYAFTKWSVIPPSKAFHCRNVDHIPPPPLPLPRFQTNSFQEKKIILSVSTTSSSTDSPIQKSLEEEFGALSIEEVKSRLLDLLPRMTGKPEENDIVSALVNTLEAKYEPVLTLEFFNMAMAGEWQLLFSTNMLGTPSASLRLRGLVQNVKPENMKGSVTNIATWDHASDGINFDTFGSLSIKNTYDISNNGAARMQMKLEGHGIKLSKGSKLPDQESVPALFGMIHNAMPSELFDPNGLGMDTTFLDANLRIVRLTANFDFDEEDGILIQEEGESDEDFQERKKLLKFEGVRNIFVRKDSMEIRPTE